MPHELFNTSGVVGKGALPYPGLPPGAIDIDPPSGGSGSWQEILPIWLGQILKVTNRLVSVHETMV
ncbi:hypothetical protein DDZ15_00890 [Rhodohalobacter mucosus]|uniref:Uncharacterized protein n=1 Tax=Rhodohalobacter mucosus TaxID=2079485 RepID=A0A316TXM7_9BACT|nr:hypothetical protein DDZ15_00890 [Rhodohalobacter mucosus]